MKASEFRKLTDQELAQKLAEAGKERFNLRMQQAAARLEKPSRLHDLRRDAARIQTVLNERKRGAQ